MRTGVLSDENAKHFRPMENTAHERHLGTPHIAKHTRTTRKRKQGYRVTQKPRSAYLAHNELSQLINPDNVKQSLPAFETHMFASMRPRPPGFFRNTVEEFKRKYPSLANRGILDESAYWFETTGIDPLPFFVDPRSTRKPLHIIVEEAIAFFGRADELESNYDQTMKLLIEDGLAAGINLNVKEEVKVELEPDGVPSQTGARAARAQASGKQARQQRIEEARAEIPDDEFYDSVYAEASLGGGPSY